MNATRNIQATNNKIEDLNLEVILLLEKINEFRKSCKFINKNLITNLGKLLGTLDDFLSSEVEEVPVPDKTLNASQVREIGADRLFVCDYCEDVVLGDSKSLQKHINKARHLRAVLERKGNNHREGDFFREDNLLAAGKRKERKPAEQKREMRKSKKDRKAAEDDRLLKTNVLPRKLGALVSNINAKSMEDAVNVANKLKEMPTYTEVRNSLLKSIRPKYPDVKVSFFGSRMCGLGTPQSDLDVFLNIGDVYNLYKVSKSDIQTKLEIVRKALKEYPDEWVNFRSVKTAKVPIIQVYNKKYQIEVDLSFSHGLGDCNTQLIKHLLSILPLAQKLSLFVKKMFSFDKLNNTASKYSLVLMVIFYLQTKNILPPLKEFQDNVEPLTIGPWIGSFVPRQLKEFELVTVENDYKTFVTHLIGFFEYYGTQFEFNSYVVCPLLGYPVLKSSFNTKIDGLERYYKHYTENPRENGLQIAEVMCVQDPFEQNHNVTKHITVRLLKMFRHYFEITAKQLKLQQQPDTAAQ